MTRRGPRLGRSRSRGLSLAALCLAACGPTAPPPETGSPGFATAQVEVRQGGVGEAPVIEWEYPGALLVEVREPTANHVIWQVQAAVTPRGQRTISPPLIYGAPALPPGVHPPDGPDYHTTVQATSLRPGARYTVVVRWPGGREGRATFTVSDPLPVE